MSELRQATATRRCKGIIQIDDPWTGALKTSIGDDYGFAQVIKYGEGMPFV